LLLEWLERRAAAQPRAGKGEKDAKGRKKKKG
jgi:hypothetical protein